MEKEGGNRERMRKCRESISLHFLIFSPFPLHFLILSSFQPGCKAATIRAALVVVTKLRFKILIPKHKSYSRRFGAGFEENSVGIV